MTNKPSWDSIWMDLALKVAKRSNDPKHKVGCIIVSLDNESVLSLGYNGDERGGSNKRDSLEHGKSGWIHAEMNSLLRINYLDPREKKAYLTLTPCLVCARMLVNAGIKKVIYYEEYLDDLRGLELLRSSNVETVKFLQEE